MISRLILSVLILSSTSAYAGTFSGYVKASSNYVFRGITFSENQPAIALSANYILENGLYGNVYGTNLKSTDVTISDQDNTREVDLTLGYIKSFGDWSTNLYINRYEYINYSEGSAFEYSFAISYKNTSLEYNFQDNWFGYESQSQYVRLTHSHHFNQKFSLIGAVGYDHQDRTKRTQDSSGKWAGAGFKNYMDYFLTFRVNEESGFSYEFSYSGTNRKLLAYGTGEETKAKDNTLTVSFLKAF